MLIGLCGKPHSGKSEVRFILERSGFEVVNVKLPLAKACHELTGVPFEEFFTQKGKASTFKGIALRNLMGKVGACMEELFGEYHTIETVLKSHEPYADKKLVVDSLRMSQTTHFPGYVLEVKSDRSIETGNPYDKYEKTNIHATVYNNGTLGELEQQVMHILYKLGI